MLIKLYYVRKVKVSWLNLSTGIILLRSSHLSYDFAYHMYFLKKNYQKLNIKCTHLGNFFCFVCVCVFFFCTSFFLTFQLLISLYQLLVCYPTSEHLFHWKTSSRTHEPWLLGLGFLSLHLWGMKQRVVVILFWISQIHHCLPLAH